MVLVSMLCFYPSRDFVVASIKSEYTQIKCLPHTVNYSTENPEILLEIASHINTNRASIDEEVSSKKEAPIIPGSK